jgi:hypothetical protein
MDQAEVGTVGACKVTRVERGIYHVQLAGYLTLEVSTQLSELVRKDDPRGPRAVLYETTDGFTGYDSQLRSVKGNSIFEGTRHIGVITSNPMLRIVTATIAIGLRTAMGIPMASYGSFDRAVAGARAALRRSAS